MTDAFFEVKNVDMYFGGLIALRDVTFGVKMGSVFGIAGPNGAGKTTLLNVVAGALKPSGGELFLEGRKISGMKSTNLCHQGVARTFQIPVVFGSLTVKDNVRVGLVFGQASRNTYSMDVDAILDFVGLRRKEDEPAANVDLFSRKLLMLAAALATGPKLLLLDEPLGGLNFQEIESYLSVVRKVNKEMGITLLVVEHLFDKLIEVSETIMILNFGQQIYLGPADEVADDPTVIEVYLGMKKHA